MNRGRLNKLESKQYSFGQNLCLFNRSYSTCVVLDDCHQFYCITKYLEEGLVATIICNDRLISY
jgi:hypothetical protein